MKKVLSILTVLLLLFSMAACEAQEDVLAFLDEFQVTNNWDTDGTLGLSIPANLPVDDFVIRITGTTEAGETLDFSTDQPIVPGQILSLEDLQDIVALHIEICLSEDGEPALVWDFDFPNHDFSRQRLR